MGSNHILLDYITGALPDLDVYGVRQMTMEQLFVRLLYEDWDAGKYTVKSADNSSKGSAAWFRSLEKYCDRLENGWDTVAVICRSMPDAARAAKELSEYLYGIESDPARAVFGSGVMVLPVEYTKGLEFDAVLILDPGREEYPVDDGHAKLLYVAATRALHELCVLHTKDLTGLIYRHTACRAAASLPAESPVISCDLPAYGSYLYAESELQMDYYFIAGKKSSTVLNAYAYLCGKL